jgi:hypothetical protein
MATSAHTTSVTAPGISGGLVTNVTVNRSGDDVIDASHLGQSAGSSANTYAAPFTGTTEVSISYIGDSIPDAGDTGAVTVTGSITVSLSNAICTSASITGSAGELITADVTFSEIST